MEFRIVQAIAKYEAEHNIRLNKSELAELLGVSRPTLAKWLNGNATGFTLAKLERLCNKLGIQPNDVLVMVEVPRTGEPISANDT